MGASSRVYESWSAASSARRSADAAFAEAEPRPGLRRARLIAGRIELRRSRCAPVASDESSSCVLISPCCARLGKRFRSASAFHAVGLGVGHRRARRRELRDRARPFVPLGLRAARRSAWACASLAARSRSSSTTSVSPARTRWFSDHAHLRDEAAHARQHRNDVALDLRVVGGDVGRARTSGAARPQRTSTSANQHTDDDRDRPARDAAALSVVPSGSGSSWSRAGTRAPAMPRAPRRPRSASARRRRQPASPAAEERCRAPAASSLSIVWVAHEARPLPGLVGFLLERLKDEPAWFPLGLM
jgi:hypothetical protein